MDLPTLIEKGITAAGMLTGVTKKLPEGIQFEFAHTQFYVPAPEGAETHLALRFLSLQGAALWGFDEEEMDAISLTDSTFILKDKASAIEKVKNQKDAKWIHGSSSKVKTDGSPMVLYFDTADGGGFVASDDLFILGPEGPLNPSEMNNYFIRWQAYHKEYFDKKGTKDALPIDFGLEKLGK